MTIPWCWGFLTSARIYCALSCGSSCFLSEWRLLNNGHICAVSCPSATVCDVLGAMAAWRRLCTDRKCKAWNHCELISYAFLVPVARKRLQHTGHTCIFSRRCEASSAGTSQTGMERTVDTVHTWKLWHHCAWQGGFSTWNSLWRQPGRFHTCMAFLQYELWDE